MDHWALMDLVYYSRTVVGQQFQVTAVVTTSWRCADATWIAAQKFWWKNLQLLVRWSLKFVFHWLEEHSTVNLSQRKSQMCRCVATATEQDAGGDHINWMVVGVQHYVIYLDTAGFNLYVRRTCGCAHIDFGAVFHMGSVITCISDIARTLWIMLWIVRHRDCHSQRSNTDKDGISDIAVLIFHTCQCSIPLDCFH